MQEQLVVLFSLFDSTRGFVIKYSNKRQDSDKHISDVYLFQNIKQKNWMH